ncbi:MAG: hypothetical protein ACP5T0_00435 [Verrucomicrobiia bacterium]
MEKDRLFVILFIVFFLAGCAARQEVKYEPVISKSPAEPAPYLKVIRVPQEKVELQVAVRRLIPNKANSPEIWIVAVSHIGESNYYHNIQSILDKSALVLYEGVGMSNSANSIKKIHTQKDKFTSSTKTESSFQEKIADTLGLVFQLDAIDYSKPNFKNCDMSFNQLQRIFTEKKTAEKIISTEAVKEWEKVKDLYTGDSFAVQLMEIALKVIGSSPKIRAMMKMVFIETLGKVDGDLSQWSGLPEGVKELFQILIRERNKVIIEQLKKELLKKKGHRKISLFYGAAHCPDLENQIVKNLNYRPLDQIWFSAMSVDLKEYKITEFESMFIENIVESIIREMRGNH